LGKTEFNLLAEVFNTRINNVFVLTEVGENAAGNILVERRNGSGARVTGVNFEGKIAPNPNYQLQFGYTIQKSLYDEPEAWSDDENVEATRTKLRTPNQYGYFTLTATPSRMLSASATGTYTGSMLVPHFAGFIAADRVVETPSFFDLNIKMTYTVKLVGVDMQLSTGVKNLFNSFQTDLDKGPMRDAGYIYGPSMPRTAFFAVKFTN